MPDSAGSLRAIVADDEAPARRRILSFLARYPEIEVVAECENGLEALGAVESHRPELLFLDVQMPGATGLEVMEALEPGSVGGIILVTAYDRFAIAAFEHHAIDYLLKPVEADRFAVALERARDRIRSRRAHESPIDLQQVVSALKGHPQGEERYLRRFLLRDSQKVTVLDVAEVEWIAADGDYLRLHTGKRSHLYRGAIGDIQERLDPAEFVRIHRSTIVRINQIRELEPFFHGDYMVALADGTRLRMSRTYRARLQEALGHPF